jgi:hypothetical protein
MMNIKTVGGFFFVMAVAVAAVLARAAWTGAVGTGSPTTSTLSGSGLALSHLPQSAPVVTPLPEDAAELQNAHKVNPALQLGSIELVGTGVSVDFYRIDNTAGPSCYAVGDKSPVSHVLGPMSCQPQFQTSADPVVDFTMLRGNPGSSDVRVWRATGFATDGVASMALEDATGQVLAAARVINNTYEFTNLPEQAAAKIVALDSNGAVVWGHGLL